jgi:hypothetical protein
MLGGSPGLYLEGDHEELVEDQRGEGDGHNFKQGILKQQNRKRDDHPAYCAKRKSGSILAFAKKKKTNK